MKDKNNIEVKNKKIMAAKIYDDHRKAEHEMEIMYLF
jgi:hypothetical protein